MSIQASKSSLPIKIRQLIDETLVIVRRDPLHEMGQEQRRRIYEALWSRPQGEKASKWLAILSARRVQPIFQERVAVSSFANDEFAMNLLDRILNIAEKILTGELSLEDVRRGQKSGSIEDFYHSILFAAENEFPYYVWLATLAADNARLEAMGYKPLQTRISSEGADENGNLIITPSGGWSEVRLAGSGAHADDAAVDAAFAFAKCITREEYDSGKVFEFWKWWLTEAIPQAWQKALSA